MSNKNPAVYTFSIQDSDAVEQLKAESKNKVVVAILTDKELPTESELNNQDASLLVYRQKGSGKIIPSHDSFKRELVAKALNDFPAKTKCIFGTDILRTDESQNVSLKYQDLLSNKIRSLNPCIVFITPEAKNPNGEIVSICAQKVGNLLENNLNFDNLNKNNPTHFEAKMPIPLFTQKAITPQKNHITE